MEWCKKHQQGYREICEDCFNDAKQYIIKLKAELKKRRKEVQQYEGMLGALREELAECRRQINDSMGAMFRIECDLGNALYGISKEGLPLWGEHTAETLAQEAARKLSKEE